MKRYPIFLSIFIFSLCSLCICADAITVTLSRNFSSDKKPEGGYPNKKTHFNKFSFGLSIQPKLAMNKYYDIEVRLTSSNYIGYAGNFGTTTSSDLKFVKADNKDWHFKAADHLQYTWGTDPKSQSVPTTVTVRCYDWGAHGDVTVTVKERDAGGMGWADTERIPYDDNGNGIGDGWETVEALKVTLANGSVGYNPSADGEVAPDENNRHPGDGWPNFDEWRGIFLSRKDTEVTRLDVTQKDVMLCSDEAMAPEGTGNLPTLKKHLIRTLEPYEEDGTWSLIKDPWGEVFTPLYKLDPYASEDTGWVNFNASGVTDRRVWAIRIEDGKTDGKKPDRVGYTSGGSPSPWTLVRILTGNIKTIVEQGYAKQKLDYEDQRRAQYEARAKEYDKKAEEAKKNGNAAEEKRFRTKARNDRTRGKNYKWNVGNKVRKDSAIELITHNAIAHEILHDHAINDHCDHAGCFMQAAYYEKYVIDYDGHLSSQVGGRSIDLSLNSAHNNTLAVTGQTRRAGPIKDVVFDSPIKGGKVPPLPPPEDEPVSPMSSLSPSNDLYTASAG